LAPELRSFPVGRYVVFYRPQDDGIDVVRVLHSARDIESISEEGGFDENTWRQRHDFAERLCGCRFETEIELLTVSRFIVVGGGHARRARRQLRGDENS
jgi:hypothetical protein